MYMLLYYSDISLSLLSNPLYSFINILVMYNKTVGQESAQKFMKQTGDLKAATLYFAS